ncbi:MAG: UpxY family transcription antiterminator [Bacteroidales bacterium]|jgi:transcription antitermination factor NusG|nr:UpxY family transcription antiterminator [Bacteroidales bacterium]
MKQWFALYTQPRKEKVLDAEFKKRGIESFLPLKKSLRQWKDRKKLIEVPLFSSYVFVREEATNLYGVLQIPGCVRFIFFDGKPVPIPDYQIESVRILLEQEVEFELKSANAKVGDRVKIREGRFSGLCGVIKHEQNKTKFSIVIDALQVDMSIIVDKSEVQLVETIK